jgi:hypothetical protein
MKSGTMVPYAQKRVKQHIGRFIKLCEDITSGSIDEPWLAEVERRDNIFADMDCAKFYVGENDRKNGQRDEKPIVSPLVEKPKSISTKMKPSPVKKKRSASPRRSPKK